MPESRSYFTSKPWITTAIGNSIQSKKKKTYEEFYKEKTHNKKRFMTYSKHLTRLRWITKDEYYKTHFKEDKKKNENRMENYNKL